MKPEEWSKLDSEVDLLTSFIRSETGHDGELDLDVDLLDAHILDSFNIVTLAMFIQEKFEVELEADDLVRENLSKLSSMIGLIRRKRGQASSMA